MYIVSVHLLHYMGDVLPICISLIQDPLHFGSSAEVEQVKHHMSGAARLVDTDTRTIPAFSTAPQSYPSIYPKCHPSHDALYLTRLRGAPHSNSKQGAAQSGRVVICGERQDARCQYVKSCIMIVNRPYHQLQPPFPPSSATKLFPYCATMFADSVEGGNTLLPRIVCSPMIPSPTMIQDALDGTPLTTTKNSADPGAAISWTNNNAGTYRG